MKLGFIDIRRAYFHAKARRRVYVQLPPEDAEPGMCGLLLKSMYGTRDAAQNWEDCYVEAMQELGFRRGLGSPCAFYNDSKNARVVVHGDDFTILADHRVIEWFVEGLRKRFDWKLKGIIGPGKEDQKEMRVLNRVVT